jgi:transcription initiation factor IIE alpha subunit
MDNMDNDGWNSEDFKCDKCGEPLGADDLDECGDCHNNTQ